MEELGPMSAEGLIMRIFWPYWLGILGMFIFAVALYFLTGGSYTTKTALGFLVACLRPGY